MISAFTLLKLLFAIKDCYNTTDTD